MEQANPAKTAKEIKQKFKKEIKDISERTIQKWKKMTEINLIKIKNSTKKKRKAIASHYFRA